MIVWINGAFGAGKTTVASILTREIRGAMFVDPELVGAFVLKVVPPGSSSDFQDLPLWRDMVVALLLNMRRRYDRPLVVPMTLVVPDYVDEVFGALHVAGETLFHVFLDVDVATLTQRIAQDEERIREWRLAQIQRCLAGRASMPQDTLFLDAAKLAPARLAARIMAQIGTAVDARDGKR